MSSDDAIKQVCQIPVGEALPHVVLDQSLTKTKEIVQAVQALQKQQEEADKKASKEIRSHAQTKEKIKLIESEHSRTRETMEKELREHASTKDKLERAEREHMKTREGLQAQRHEVSSMLLQMEALKVEMEAQRKAFVVNVNWAARCTELKAKFDTSREDYDKLWDQHAATKASLENAHKAREEYRNKSISSLECLEQAREDIARNAAELEGRTGMTDEIVKKLEEWRRFKEEAAAVALSSKGKSKAMGVLERQLAQGDSAIKVSFFSGWSTFVVEERKQKKHKDQAMKQAMKTIANEGMGLMSQCFTAWRRENDHQKRHQMQLANQRLEEANASGGGRAAKAREKALAQLEKQFLGQDKALTKSAFGAWASGQALRKKKEANMQKGARMIANSGKALMIEVLFVWNAEAENTRKQKAKKEAGNHQAARMIAGGGKALVADVFQTWQRYVQAQAEERKKKAAGNQKAARMMANSAGTLMNLCFDGWGKLQAEKAKKDAGNKKAARMIAGSNQAIVIGALQGWIQLAGTKKAKEAGNAKAARMMNASGEALQVLCFQGWKRDVQQNREKNKKMRAIEKTLGASAEGLKMIVATGWRNITLSELRKKRSKSSAMASSMKSINGNQDLLMTQMTMSWARVVAAAAVEKLEAKVVAAQAALDEAMLEATRAVEEDVGRCQQEVERLRGELAAVKKQLAEASAKAASLESQIEQADATVAEREGQLNALVSELEDSRRKARDIGEELAKVGIFLQSTPRKPTRPRSGTKGGQAEGLPKISGQPGRPMSGRGGNKGIAPRPAWNEAEP